MKPSSLLVLWNNKENLTVSDKVLGATMREKDFVTFLVDETLNLQKKREVGLLSLESKLNDYRLNFIKGEFIPQSQILRFKAPFGNLDVPINWSVFSVENSTTDHVILDAKNDVDHFFSIIKTAWNSPIHKLLITHADGFCYLVGLKLGEENHLHDLIKPQEWLKSA
jgi:hypothetical protein